MCEIEHLPVDGFVQFRIICKENKEKNCYKKPCRHKSDFSDSAKNIIFQFQDLDDVSINQISNVICCNVLKFLSTLRNDYKMGV